MSTLGYATLPVILSMDGVTRQAQQSIVTPLSAAGQAAGQRAGQGIASGLRSSASSVEQASRALSAARDKEADAAGKVRVAEAALQDLRARGITDGPRLVRAEEALERARRAQNQASDRVRDAQRDLARATRDSTDANREAAAAADDAADASSGLAEKVKGAAGELKNLAIATAGIAGIGKVISDSMDFEVSTDKLAASLGATPETAKVYGEAAANVYKQAWGESMDEVAEAVGAVQSSFKGLGQGSEQSLESATTMALGFASTFGTDVASAVQTTSQLITDGLAKDSTQAFDLLTTSFQKVPAAMRDELPEILQEYGTHFRALGFEGPDAFNLLISAANKGKFALDKTGDALKEFTIRGSDMSTSSVAAFESIELNAQEMSDRIAQGGPMAQEALQATAAGLLSITDPAERANTAIALFGTPLEDLSVDQVPQFLSALAGGEDALGSFEGATDQMLTTVGDNGASKLEAFKRAVQVGLVDALNASLGWISDNKDMLVQLGIVAGTAALALGGIAAAQAVIAAGGLLNWIRTTTAAIWLQNAAWLANPIGLIVIGIAALVAAFIILWNKSEGFRNFMIAAWDAIKNAFSAAWDWIAGILENIGAKVLETKDWVVGKWNELVDFVTGLPGKIASAASGMWDGIKDAFKAALNWIIDKWNSLDFTISIPKVHIPGTNIDIGDGEITLGLPDIPRLNTGGLAGRKSNGMLYGPGTSTSDSILALDQLTGVPSAFVSRDESVNDAKTTKRWWWLLKELPHLSTGGRLSSRTPELAVDGGGSQSRSGSTWADGFASPFTKSGDTSTVVQPQDSAADGELGGGTINKSIWDYISTAVPGATLNSGYRAGDPGYHGIKQAVDVGGPLTEVADAAFRIKDQLAQIIFDDANHPWYNVRKNQLGTGVATAEGQAARDIYGAETMAGHGDHVHIAAEDMVTGGSAQSALTASNPASDTGTSSSASDAGSSAASGQQTRFKTLHELGSDLGGILADGLVESLELPKFIADPNVLLEGDDGSNVRTSVSSSAVATDEPKPAGTPEGRNGLTGSALYSYDITKVAKDMGLPEAAAVIGNAVGLVETNLQMYANSSVPESLQYPHDAVGSDHDSVGVFQQRPSWGSVADRMNSPVSAGFFFDALKAIDWQSMDPGAAAQAVQRSAFPDRYGQQMGAAADWVKKAGLYDSGGFIEPGGLALSMLKKPEPLLPADKWDIARDNIAAVDDLVSAGRGGRSDGKIADQIILQGYTQGDLIDGMRREQWRRTSGSDGRNW